jgi:hypothetical protein
MKIIKGFIIDFYQLLKLIYLLRIVRFNRSFNT